MVSRSPQRQNKAKQKGQQSSGSVRIISGLWKGRKLKVTEAQGLRPTTDRVKETLFNWLMFEVANARVLDCFAGSGSLSFEAASRGASKVEMLELNPAACASLRNNIQQLNAIEQISVQQTDAMSYTQNPCQQPFDIIFIDPPFRKNMLPSICNNLTKQGFIQSGTLIYIEHETELPQLELPEHWRMLKSAKAGQSQYNLYQAD